MYIDIVNIAKKVAMKGAKACQVEFIKVWSSK
jgi:hypothetical protein